LEEGSAITDVIEGLTRGFHLQILISHDFRVTIDQARAMIDTEWLYFFERPLGALLHCLATIGNGQASAVVNMGVADADIPMNYSSPEFARKMMFEGTSIFFFAPNTGG
jgi:hypothetical protein